MARLSGLAVVISLTVFSNDSRAGMITYFANLSGPAESPPNNSPGVGFAEVDFDTVAHTMRVQATFSGLLGTTTNAHIHSATALPGVGTAGVATQVPYFEGFPIGVTSGTYDHTFNTLLDSFYNPAFETANGGTAASAETALLAGMAAGEAYFNIHTTVSPGGEIRGFLSQSIPEPSSVVMLGMGTLGLMGFAWRRRRRAA